MSRPSWLSPQPSSIPVFDWHELNNGCDPTAPVCNAADPESVSTAQLTAELAYLKAQGYQTISALQYEYSLWSRDPEDVILPLARERSHSGSGSSESRGRASGGSTARG